MTNRRLRPGEILLSLLAFVLVTALLFHDVTLEGKTIASAPHVPFTLFEGPVGYQRTEKVPFSDAGGAALANEASVPYRARAFGAGGLPFWQPHVGCGQPYLAGYQPGLFFPLHFLMLAGPGPLGLDLTYLGRLVLAGWFLYLFLRVLGLARLASFAGGLVFLGSGYLVTDVNSTNVSVECTVPGLLLALELLVTRNRRRDFVLAVLMVLLVLAGGNPEAAVLGFLLGAVYAVGRILFSVRTHRLRSFVRLMAVHLLGALIFAPQILPFLEFLSRSEHYHGPSHHIVTAPLSFLAVFVAPGLFDHVDFGLPASVYGTGTVGCVLAVLSLAGRRHRFLTIFAWAGLLFTAAVYFDAPGFRELGTLPLINRFSLFKYPAAHLCLHLAILSGLGVEALLDSRLRRPARHLAVACAGVGLVPVLFTLLWNQAVFSFQFNTTFPLVPGPSGPHFGALPYLLAGALGLGLVLAWRPGWTRPAAVGLTALALVEVYLHIPRYYPPRKDIYRPPAFLAGLEKPFGSYRIYSPEPILFPNVAAVFGLHDIRYLEVLKIDRYVNLIRTAFDYPLAAVSFNHIALRSGVPVHPLEVLGVRHVLARGPLVPLSACPVPGGSRLELAVDLRGGSGTLEGELVVPAGEAGQVELLIRNPHPFRAGTIRTFEPGEPFNRVAHRPTRDERIRTTLAVHFEPGTSLELASARWAGQTVSRDALEAGSQNAASPGGYYRFENFRAGPERRIQVRKPFRFALPAGPENGSATLELDGRSTGTGTVSTALLDYKVEPWKRLDFSNSRGTVSRRIPFRVDLAPLTGRRVVLSLEMPDRVRLEGLRLSPEGLTPTQILDGVTLYEIRGARPRAYGVYEAEVLPDAPAQLTRLLDLGFPADRRVILEARPAGFTPVADPPPEPPEVVWIHEDPAGSSLELEARFPAAGLLVLLDNFFPGWTARVDGQPVEIARANYTFRAVPVPAGDHRVTFRYRPTHWLLGLALSVLGVVAVIAYVIFPGSPRGRARNGHTVPAARPGAWLF